MASPEFSKSMTAQELCAYLEEVGMEESDLKTIHDGMYNGKTILLLGKKNRVKLEQMQLSAAGTLVLEILLDEEAEKQEEMQRIEAEKIEAEQIQAEKRESERVEEERKEAERIKLERAEAERREAERVEAERMEAVRIEAREAERIRAQMIESQRVEDYQRMEAQRIEAQRLEMLRIQDEQRVEEYWRMEGQRMEAQRIEAQRVEEYQRMEAQRIEVQRVEEYQRMEAQRIEAQRVEEYQRMEAQRIGAQRGMAAPPAVGFQLQQPLSLEPVAEYQEYTGFGLGYGVDATDPSPLRCKHGKVRLVLPEVTNVEETIKKERYKYEDIISSMATQRSLVHNSVLELMAKSLSLSAEGEFTRERSQELVARGERAVMRTVSFKPFCSREYHPVGAPEVTDSTFERELCEWLTQQIPGILSMPGGSHSDRLHMYLMEFPDKEKAVVQEAYIFVKTEKVTHYISAISLGAAEYSVSINTSGGGNLSTGVSGDKTTKAKANAICKDHRIGDIDDVERRKGEAVLSYEILPVYMVVRQETVKKVLQKAIKFYLERESGPFFITCGNKYDKFLRVFPINKKNMLMATEKKEEADIFFIEKGVCPGEFNIAYYVDEASLMEKSGAMYVTTKSKMTGKDDGPLQVGIARGANFTLRHSHKETLSVEEWEKAACYIKVATRRAQHKSYVGLNEKKNFTICVPKQAAEKANSVWLQFKLERVRDEGSSRGTIFRAPGAVRSRPQLIKPSSSMEEEEEVDFDYEFEQVPSDDSD